MFFENEINFGAIMSGNFAKENSLELIELSSIN
jgi:hypothetical protein